MSSARRGNGFRADPVGLGPSRGTGQARAEYFGPNLMRPELRNGLGPKLYGPSPGEGRYIDRLYTGDLRRRSATACPQISLPRRRLAGTPPALRAVWSFHNPQLRRPPAFFVLEDTNIHVPLAPPASAPSIDSPHPQRPQCSYLR